MTLSSLLLAKCTPLSRSRQHAWLQAINSFVSLFSLEPFLKHLTSCKSHSSLLCAHGFVNDMHAAKLHSLLITPSTRGRCVSATCDEMPLPALPCPVQRQPFSDLRELPFSCWDVRVLMHKGHGVVADTFLVLIERLFVLIETSNSVHRSQFAQCLECRSCDELRTNKIFE